MDVMSAKIGTLMSLQASFSPSHILRILFRPHVDVGKELDLRFSFPILVCFTGVFRETYLSETPFCRGHPASIRGLSRKLVQHISRGSRKDTHNPVVPTYESGTQSQNTELTVDTHIAKNPTHIVMAP